MTASSDVCDNGGVKENKKKEKVKTKTTIKKNPAQNPKKAGGRSCAQAPDPGHREKQRFTNIRIYIIMMINTCWGL